MGSLMMDEVQTGGGATGKMWCHEHFGIEADVVSFSKKMLSGGIYHNLEHRPPHPGRILNTWVGDPHKIIMLEQVVNTIKEESLLDLVTNLERQLWKAWKIYSQGTQKSSPKQEG